MTDLRLQYAAIKQEVDCALNEVLSETGFILGRQLVALEKEIAAYYGVAYAVGVASGSDALVLALAAGGIKPGDEVITTPFTFIATAEAIFRVGAIPVFCDVSADTANLDPELIENAITPKTKAILPVHLYGLSCDMGRIVSIAEKHGLEIFEDCAQSFGSEYQGRKTGTFGLCACLSFFPAKTLGCYGDGGMVLTNDPQTAQRLRVLRDHGSETKYHYSLHGFNSRLDTLQAAVLSVKMKYIDSWIDARISNASIYRSLLSRVPGIELLQEPAGYKHTYNYFNIKAAARDKLKDKLARSGISSAVYYPLSLHLQEVCAGLGYKKGDFPAAEFLQDRILALPMYPELSKEDIVTISEAISRD